MQMFSYIFALMNETVYICGASSLEEKKTRLEQIILALLDQSIESAANSDLDYYILDDGQTKITTSYRDPRRIAEAIEKYQKIYVTICNMLNGRGMILRNWRALR